MIRTVVLNWRDLHRSLIPGRQDAMLSHHCIDIYRQMSTIKCISCLGEHVHSCLSLACYTTLSKVIIEETKTRRLPTVLGAVPVSYELKE